LTHGFADFVELGGYHLRQYYVLSQEERRDDMQNLQTLFAVAVEFMNGHGIKLGGEVTSNPISVYWSGHR
jgi:hypothetical protein